MKSDLAGGNRPFISLLLIIGLVQLCSKALFRWGFRTQFYLWEFKLDLGTIAIAILALLLCRKLRLTHSFASIGIGRWNWRDNAIAFCSPLVLLAGLIGMGLIFRGVTYQGVDNTLTFLLTILFDIPATLFFSISLVLVEEITFRGFIFSLFSKTKGFFLSALLSSALWGFYSLFDLVRTQNLNWSTILAQFVSASSAGFLCSALFIFSGSIWSSYAFRMGLLTFSSALISMGQDESNTFFISKYPSFSNSGLVLSVLNLLLAFVLVQTSKKRSLNAGL